MGYTQCHFFAGIGGWSYALRLAGWPDDRPVWTGSCPCQPFSGAGLGLGTADERHLWPEIARLIGECAPPVCFGEQVASAAGRSWLASVRSDLEGMGYGVGAADLCAAGTGAPHVRQRLFWMANADHERRDGERVQLRRDEPGRISGTLLETSGSGAPRGVASAMHTGRPERGAFAGGGSASWGCGASGMGSPSGEREVAIRGVSEGSGAECAGGAGGLVDAVDARLEGHGGSVNINDETGREAAQRHGTAPGFWSGAEWVKCSDGTMRPVEPGTFPLAPRVPNAVGMLRGYGNAIVPQVAAEFVMASMEAIDEVAA